MRVQHNIPSMNSYRNYNNNTRAINKNLEKLSSGYKINRAGDDAAGLAISEKMRAQITGLDVAQKNAKDGISLVQTAEGALTEVHDMLNRMYSLAEQSANGTYDKDVDRQQLQKEVDKLRGEIDRIATTANFNGIELFKTSSTSAMDTTPQTRVATKGTDSFIKTASAFTFDASATQAVKDTLTEALNEAGGVNLTIGATDAGAMTLTSGTLKDANGNAYTFAFKSGAGQFSGTATDSEHEIEVKNSAGTTVGSFKVTLDGKADSKWFDSTNGNFPTSLKDAVVTFRPNGTLLQIGDTGAAPNQLVISTMDMTDSTLKIDASNVKIDTQTDALNSLDNIKSAINMVSDYRGTLGATQNRLEHTINNLSVMKENIQDAESTIRDTDVADEMMKYTKNSILVQSAQAMLAQANQQPQGVLQLLQ